MKHTIYKVATGQIARSVSAPQEQMQYQCGLDENYIEGEFGDESFYIQDGVAVPIPSRPSQNHEFDYDTKQWILNAQVADSLAKALRVTLLSTSDWTQLPDVPLATKEAWATYRQALRNITEQPGYPLEVVWPQQPE